VGMRIEKIPVLHLQSIIRSHLGSPTMEWNRWCCSSYIRSFYTP